jgi:hypothetical protein
VRDEHDRTEYEERPAEDRHEVDVSGLCRADRGAAPVAGTHGMGAHHRAGVVVVGHLGPVSLEL